ncbi:IS3 family transposase [Photobacterium aquimaris]|uniref:IS3 family transposase n=1 Tax=Photobacterium aquimaris TaxID=512643 RepID=A0A2T3HWM2_9GAMM|nr:hypothetical protein AYY21_03080 [Photobacterium aquimaris]PSU03233.1 IS3 family transposase [Photobacterium aquimaris]
MTNRTRRLFSAEFKLEAAQLVLEQNYSLTEAIDAVVVMIQSMIHPLVNFMIKNRSNILPKPLTKQFYFYLINKY